MKMAHAVLVEVFFLNQRQICISFHVSYGCVWWSARLELERITNHLLLIHIIDRLVVLSWWHAIHLLLAHLAHALAHTTSLRIVLLLLLLLLLATLKLAECILVCFHVAVIWQIWIIRSTLVLKRLYGRGKVYFAFEKFLTGYLVELIGRISIGWICDTWVIRANSCILIHRTELHGHLIATLRRSILLFLVEVWDISIRRLLLVLPFLIAFCTTDIG